jgi:lipoprotein-anchoring transpeptidase ErfK/SrfK
VVASNPPAATPPAERLEPPITVLEVQLALNRLGYSAGSIDGLVGSQTRAAIRAFQSAVDLPATGAVDAATRERLRFAAPGLETYEVAEADIDRLLPLSPTWLGKSEQQRLDYETLTELVAEKFQAHPKLIRSLNPQVDWQNAKAGLRLYVPHVSPPTAPAVAASVRIRLSQRILEVRDDEDRLLAHFPCSIARLVEKRPVGTLRVVTIIRNPSYTFNPEIFPESEEGRRLGRKLVLPPGPNNPVGVAWIGLSRSGYGIHGTPRPEEVGRTESHGCFRLANWNAERLAQLVRVGTPVYVEP